MANKRVRGVAVHRPILIGSTSTPLTAAEKLSAPPDHTHKWTVAVRSAASHPLPSVSAISGSAANPDTPSASGAAQPGSGTVPSTGTATISTRGRDQEFDFHKMVGGKDDISHFIKRVQFKLHDTYAQPTRNIDRPPFSVTETGWGEFEIQVKIFFVPEANEKPVTAFHHLKLHPWLNMIAPPPQPAPDSTDAAGQISNNTNHTPTGSATDPIPAPDAVADPVSAAQAGAVAETNETKIKQEEEGDQGEAGENTEKPMGTDEVQTGSAAESAIASQPPKPALPPVVHSWQYDEIVFAEPTETFYEILTAHPPTPLPATSAQAFADPSAYRSYQSAIAEAGPNAPVQPLLPPHPLHAANGSLFDALSQEAQQGEADRLDLARISAVKELERGRDELIKAEKALKETRAKLNTLNAALIAGGRASQQATS